MTQLPLDLALVPAPQRTPRSFHARHCHVTAGEAEAGEARAKRQEDEILAWFEFERGVRYTPHLPAVAIDFDSPGDDQFGDRWIANAPSQRPPSWPTRCKRISLESCGRRAIMMKPTCVICGRKMPSDAEPLYKTPGGSYVYIDARKSCNDLYENHGAAAFQSGVLRAQA